MAFIDDWNNLQTAIPRSEIQFFRFLATLLEKHHGNVHYYEVHGRKGWVEFQSSLWPAKAPIQKELGDLIILTYSYAIKEARYTVQQNKFHKGQGVQRIRPVFKFGADIHQYDLLAFRPDIKPKGSIPFPTDILSGTDYDTVGSYGVFHEGAGHLVDFAYSAASWLTPQSYVDKCNLIMNCRFDRMLINGREVVCAIGIEGFVECLLGMVIGAPIVDANVGSFFSGLIRRGARERGEEPPVIDLPVFNELRPLDLDGEGSFRLLVIGTDLTPER